MEAALYIHYKVNYDRQYRVRNGLVLPIVALPLRRLRDQVFSTYFDDIVAFKFVAHDEICNTLKKRIKDEGDYWKALAKHLVEDECKYKEHVKELMEAIKRNKIIVTTHGLAPLADVLAKHFYRKPLVIFDEAEDYLERIGRGLDASIVETVKELNSKLYNKLKKTLKLEHYKYYYRASTLASVLRDAVLLSATFPKSLKYVYPFIAGKELDETTFFTRQRKEKDVLIFYLNKLLWKDYENWKHVVYPQLVEIVRRALMKHKVVGIVSRNYTMTREIEEMLRSVGYRVVSDFSKNFKSEINSAQVIIITTKGKLYRGINILPHGADVPVVISFWQGMLSKEHHPYIIDVLQEIGWEDKDLWPMYVREMTMSKNLQAVYRFVRQHQRRHIIVLWDIRFHEAYYHWFKDYLYENVVKVEVEDLMKVADVVKEYL